MKRFISLILSVLTLLTLLSLTSCDNANVDLREKENIYDDLAAIIKAPDEYKGKTIALTST
jgi:hypothetical protein